MRECIYKSSCCFINKGLLAVANAVTSMTTVQRKRERERGSVGVIVYMGILLLSIAIYWNPYTLITFIQILHAEWEQRSFNSLAIDMRVGWLPSRRHRHSHTYTDTVMPTQSCRHRHSYANTVIQTSVQSCRHETIKQSPVQS